MVQLPEITPPDSEARKAGYSNIADLSKERIRRAGTKIKDEAGLAGENLDIGFRVLKVDSPNTIDLRLTPDETSQEALIGFVNNLKPGRTEEDLLFHVMLDWGLELSLPITASEISGATVFSVDNGALLACFAQELTREVIEYMAKAEPLRAVFRDASFTKDDDRINAEQIFREISPATDVRVI